MTVDLDYFISAEPNILDNLELREAQITAYVRLFHHFVTDHKKEHAVCILPTGAGKTGVIALAPFGISHGRVLVITPQLVIKDRVLESLDPSMPENFWMERNVFAEFYELPVLTEYDKDTHLDELRNSNIVVLNVHKLSTQARNSLLRKVDPHFFDMIIIDEAHHSPAKTWQDALEFFKDAKVVKVTGTPFRTDQKEIEGTVLINYRLGQAMADKIVKLLKNFVLIPEQVFMTIGDDSRQYTLEEIRQLGIKDEDFITKSVALSEECNHQIVGASIEALHERRQVSNVPHKIIAVCCNIEHANRITALYEAEGLRVSVVHSKLSPTEKKEALRKIEGHQVDVAIHVAMLGEGYDHPYLSVAAIFRPYRGLAPYAQFIGRILRRIPKLEAQSPLDNVGVVIAHKELGLDELWNEYQRESMYCDVLETIRQSGNMERKQLRQLANTRQEDVGSIQVKGNVTVEEEFYEYSEAAREQEEYERQVAEQVDKLRSMLPNKTDSELKRLVLSEKRPQNVNPLLNNPKKMRLIMRTEFNRKVQYDIPAELLTQHGLEKAGTELTNLKVKDDLRWILDKGDNAAIISLYLNGYLKQVFGDRENWTVNDYTSAEKRLPKVVEHLSSMIKSLKKRR